MSPRAAIKRVLWCAGIMSATALTSLPATADYNAPRKDEWRFVTQGPFGLSSGGSRNSFYFQATPGTAFSSFNGTRGFVQIGLKDRHLEGEGFAVILQEQHRDKFLTDIDLG